MHSQNSEFQNSKPPPLNILKILQNLQILKILNNLKIVFAPHRNSEFQNSKPPFKFWNSELQDPPQTAEFQNANAPL